MFQSQGYPNVFPWIDRNHHETENLNLTIDRTAERGLKFWHMVNDDVEYRCVETIPAMYDYIRAYSDVGAIHPWTEGEIAEPNAMPYDAYLQDATGLLAKVDINGWMLHWDESFLFTGWADLDIGFEINRHGGRILNDRRYPVKHVLANTRKRGQKKFLLAMERRNRLILTAKWDVVGIDGWRGVNEYNKTVPPEKKIPSMFEIANYTTDEQDLFAHSVVYEHPPIYKMNGEVDPTLFWENPIITGHNVREMWESGWRPDKDKDTPYVDWA
jgi:hypothetical protein